LEKVKDGGFAISTTAAFSLDTFGPKVWIHQLRLLLGREMNARKIQQSFF
jgi:hypothetical protein